MKNQSKLLIALTATWFGVAQAQSDVPEGMEISAQEWCKNVEAGWNLGNSFEGCGADWDYENWTWRDGGDPYARLGWETSWIGHKTTQSDIEAVARAGFNAIRIPIRWEPHVLSHETMEIDPAWVARVKEVVDWSLDAGMYVLINIHHEKWLEANPVNKHKDLVNAMLSKLWTNIATAFAGYDGRLAFAGVNEVHIEDDWGSPSAENTEVLSSYLQTFVDAVRATGGNNLYRNLVVQTYVCNPDFGITIPTDVVDDRLSVEFHYYQPWNYCGLGIDYYWDDVDGLRRVMDKAWSQWWKQGLGVVVGEFGCTMHYDKSASAEEQERQKQNVGYYNEVITRLMRERGFAGFVWDNNSFENPASNEDLFGVFDRNKGMACRNTYVLSSIMEGAGKEYIGDELPVGPEVPELEEYTGNGTALWEGNEEMNWGDGLQLSLPNSGFADLESGARLELYYTTVGGGAMVQMFDGYWSTPNELVFDDGKGNTGFEFGLPSGEHCLSLTITDATLQIIQSKGLVIQGYAAVLQRVVIVNASDETGEETKDPDGEQDENPDGEQDENQDDDPQASDNDWYRNLYNGQLTWSGSKAIEWSNGLYIPKATFGSLPIGTGDNLLVIYYKITNQESMLKFCYDDNGWKALQLINGEVMSEVFQCKANTDAQAGKNIMVLNLPASALTDEYLRGHDMVIQGTGVIITGYLIVNANDMEALPVGDVDGDSTVDVGDILSLENYLNQPKKAQWMINHHAADVDDVEGIGQGDVDSIAEMILNQ